jgi:hypothetical protein
VGIGSLTARVWFLKIGLCRVIRIPDGVIRAGTRLLVVCGKHINGWGVGHRARLSLHIPQGQVLEDLFNLPAIALAAGEAGGSHPDLL